MPCGFFVLLLLFTPSRLPESLILGRLRASGHRGGSSQAVCVECMGTSNRIVWPWIFQKKVCGLQFLPVRLSSCNLTESLWSSASRIAGSRFCAVLCICVHFLNFDNRDFMPFKYVLRPSGNRSDPSRWGTFYVDILRTHPLRLAPFCHIPAGAHQHSVYTYI